MESSRGRECGNETQPNAAPILPDWRGADERDGRELPGRLAEGGFQSATDVAGMNGRGYVQFCIPNAQLHVPRPGANHM